MLMLPLLFFGVEQPVTTADVEAIEQEYGFKLPEDYKTHIIEHNGGWPSRKIFWQVNTDEHSVERRISDLYSIIYVYTERRLWKKALKICMINCILT
jgi:cell wall assembly regulator SMI1